ncbi:hypothetical protein ACP70R_020265 [Stipagrostis hirtigluma subsp. patula]
MASYLQVKLEREEAEASIAKKEFMDTESPPTGQVTLPPHAAEETERDETINDASQVDVPVPQSTDAEEESKVVDTSFEITTSVATKLEVAQTEIDTFEAISAEATATAENLGEKSKHAGSNMDMPADSTEENPGANITSETVVCAESGSRVVEQPRDSLPTMQELPATEEPAGDTKVTAKPESLLHGLTPAEAETVQKTEEEDGDNALQSGSDEAYAKKLVQFTGEVATDGAAPAASNATAGIEDHKEEPKDETAGEIFEAQDQAISCMTSTISDDANDKVNSGGEVEELTAEAADEPEIISHPDVTTPASVGQDTVGSTENVQNDEAKLCESQKSVVEAPHSVEDKTLEAEAVQEKNDDESPSDDMSFVTEVEVTPEVSQDTEIVKESGKVSQEPIPVCSIDVQNDEANPCDGQEGIAEVPNQIEDKISEAVQEKNDDTIPSDEMSCVTEVAVTPDVGQDTVVVTESDSVSQEPIPVSSTDVQNDEANPCEGQEGVAEAPNRIAEKMSEAKAVQEKNDDSSPSDDISSIAEVAAIPEVVEQINRRTLQGLLMVEKNTENLTTGPTDTIAGPHSTTAQEFDSNNSVEKTPDVSKENIAADNSELVVSTTKTAQVVEVDSSIITNEVVKESVLENANAVAEDTKQTKSVTERYLGLGNLSKDISNEEGKQGELQKVESTEAVKPQRHTNNIMSKVKQSIVKVKKVIIGKSPSSKALTTTVEAGEINVK